MDDSLLARTHTLIEELTEYLAAFHMTEPQPPESGNSVRYTAYQQALVGHWMDFQTRYDGFAGRVRTAFDAFGAMGITAKVRDIDIESPTNPLGVRSLIAGLSYCAAQLAGAGTLPARNIEAAHTRDGLVPADLILLDRLMRFTRDAAAIPGQFDVTEHFQALTAAESLKQRIAALLRIDPETGLPSP